MQSKAARKTKGESAAPEPNAANSTETTWGHRSECSTGAGAAGEQQFCASDHRAQTDEERSTVPKRALGESESSSSLFTRIRCALLRRTSTDTEAPSTASASRSASVDSVASVQSQSTAFSSLELFGGDGDARNLSLSAGDMSHLSERDLLDIVEQPESAPNAAQAEPNAELLESERSRSDARELELLSQFHVPNDDSAFWNECAADDDEDDDCVLIDELSDPFVRRAAPAKPATAATAAAAAARDTQNAAPSNAGEVIAPFDGVFLVPLYCEGFSRHAYGDTERRRGGALQVVRALELLRPRFVVLYSPRVSLVRTVEACLPHFSFLIPHSLLAPLNILLNAVGCTFLSLFLYFRHSFHGASLLFASRRCTRRSIRLQASVSTSCNMPTQSKSSSTSRLCDRRSSRSRHLSKTNRCVITH